MELYLIDCIWIVLTVTGVAVTSPKIITNNGLFQQLTTFGKTRIKTYPFDVPKAWFTHFYLLGSLFFVFLLYRWCMGTVEEIRINKQNWFISYQNQSIRCSFAQPKKRRPTQFARNRSHVDYDASDFGSKSIFIWRKQLKNT